MNDEAIIKRIQAKPVRYVIHVDVGNQPPVQQSETIQRWIAWLKR